MTEQSIKKNIQFYVSQNCSVFSLKFLLKNHLKLKDIDMKDIEINLEKTHINSEETEKIPIEDVSY